MTTRRFLLLQRGNPAGQSPPSPAQMQEMHAAFYAWKARFKDNIAELGGRLAPSGKVLTAMGTIDGPLIESKEIVGGYMIVVADDYERALEVAQGCPGLIGPGSSCEIREIIG